MIDRLFPAVLTFAVLAGSTLAIGSEFFSAQAGVDRTSAVVTLPRVVITGNVQQNVIVARSEAITTVR
jgi:hypothetical protein